MAKPPSRTPLDKPAGDLGDLAPAPDTGKPYGAAEDAPEAAGTRSRRQPTKHLHVRIPEELFQQLQDVSEETGIPQTRIVVRALRSELEQLA